MYHSGENLQRKPCLPGDFPVAPPFPPEAEYVIAGDAVPEIK